MFEEFQDSLMEREQKIGEFWQREKIFQQSVKKREEEGSPLFSFYDGPPFATGLPHYGHLLAGTIKDAVLRYKTMRGYWVPRRFGWDCHGLPVEHEIEKAFELSTGEAIHQFGIGRFNEECRSIVLRYSEEWKTIVNRMGRWVDFDNLYRTMDLSFMESVWWAFKQLYEKGLIYEGYKVMPYSAKLGTPLSNFEASDNYKDVDDPAITIAFPLLSDPQTAFLAWTTTPWTLVSHMALMVGPDIRYVKIRNKVTSKQWILAEERLGAHFADPESYDRVESFLGKDLIGLTYQPPFAYFKERADQGAFRVILEDSVSVEEGTGIVHSAPAFGEVDFYACQRAGIDLVCPVDGNGRFTAEIPEYKGLFVKDADKEIIAKLKSAGILFSQATIHHRYPFCWRSDTPLIYKAVTTWFVAVEKIKDKLIAANESIYWMPSHIKEGRFGKWLEGARDWSISRNRYWGTPIPIWKAADGSLKVVGSIAELEKLTKVKIDDLHRHHIDQLEVEADGKRYKRIPEVFDCWFESGSMPYAQIHYPFENREYFEKSFPANFIAEGADQTRGWFYTLTVMSAALFDQPAFLNVIVNGIVLAEDGTKMSKRLKNYPEPSIVIDKYGADAVRLYLLNSPAVHAEDLRFSEKGVETIMRHVLIPFWNAHNFFVTYARIYDWQPSSASLEALPEALIDRWILAKLHRLIQEVQTSMDLYDLDSAVHPFVEFVEELTNWYIRRSRTRFWSDVASADRDQAFATLYTILLELSKVSAPFIPFLSESIYRNLATKEMPCSVHLCNYPAYQSSLRDVLLEEGMAQLQTVVSLGHALRKEQKIKVRQPLKAVYLCTESEQILRFLENQSHLIAEELNVKEVIFSHDEGQFVSLAAKPNFRVLGKKVGKWMKSAQELIAGFTQDQMSRLLAGSAVAIQLEDQQFLLTSEDVLVERTVKPGVVASHSGSITVALDINLNEELLIEGLAREFRNKINTMRRDANLAVTDRIKVEIETTDRAQSAFQSYYEFIAGEVLATEVRFQPCKGTEWDLNGEKAVIAISKQ